MDDIRWFASNAYTRLVVPALRRLDLRVTTEGARPARLALAMSGHAAVEAWRFARRWRSRLVVYLWDLPPRGLGDGRPDHVWWVMGRFLRIPRIRGRYRRGGYFSVLEYISRRAEAVWVPSGMTQQSVAERFGVRAAEVPYCYDSGRFLASEHRASRPREGPPTLLTVSRLRRHKNQAAVIRAAALMGDRNHVRLIGRGPQHERLAALAARLGVSCTIETNADDASVTRAYHEAAVAVCPSAFEGFGLTPIEAVACGVPVVASDIPPHREFVGRAARFAPPDDYEALASAIENALGSVPADPELVADLTIPAAASRFAGALRPLLA